MGITDRRIVGLRKAIIITIINALLSTHSADKASKLDAMEHVICYPCPVQYCTVMIPPKGVFFLDVTVKYLLVLHLSPSISRNASYVRRRSDLSTSLMVKLAEIILRVMTFELLGFFN